MVAEKHEYWRTAEGFMSLARDLARVSDDALCEGPADDPMLPVVATLGGIESTMAACTANIVARLDKLIELLSPLEHGNG